jgi:hypothetical protein
MTQGNPIPLGLLGGSAAAHISLQYHVGDFGFQYPLFLLLTSIHLAVS